MKTHDITCLNTGSLCMQEYDRCEVPDAKSSDHYRRIKIV